MPPLARFLYVLIRVFMNAKKKILIVDDDPGFRELVLCALNSEDRILFTAGNSAEARHYLKEEIFDLLLLDLYLPDGTGIDLISEFRQGLPNQPSIILMTAYGNWETHILAYRLGIFYYLDKPFKITQLRTLVHQALSMAEVQ